MKLRLILIEKRKIEEEIRQLCKEVYVEAKRLLQIAKSVQDRVFYLKMIADVFRYLAQLERGKALLKLIDETRNRYEKAMGEAESLEDTNPIKLALILNFSVFEYEIAQNFEAAIQKAQNGFEASVLKFKKMPAKSQEDTLRIMVLLEENIELFKIDEDH